MGTEMKPISEIEKKVDRKGPYTVLDIEPSTVPIPLKSDDPHQRLLSVLKTIAPEYFDSPLVQYWEKHWEDRCDNSESGIGYGLIPETIFSELRVRVFKKKLKSNDQVGRGSAYDRRILSWSDLQKKELPADFIKSIILEHKLTGMKNPSVSDEGLVGRFDYEIPLVNLNKGYKGGHCPGAYEAVLYAILTGEKLSKAIEDQPLINIDTDTIIHSGIFNPTLERVGKATGELRKFFNYVEHNKENICFLAAKLYNSLKGKDAFERLASELKRKDLGIDLAIADYAKKEFMESMDNLDGQIRKLPTFKSTLNNYI